MEYFIHTYCQIKENTISVNGESFFTSSAPTLSEFLKEAYQKLAISYPKFHKMDKMSKLALISSEIVLKGVENGENVALVFSNDAASLDTDINYQESIGSPDNYYPSPAVFVYTLPNICLGEVSIRHGFNTENAFFVSAGFNADKINAYTEYLLQSGKAEKVLVGWVEILENNYECFMYLVDTKGSIPYSKQQILTIYNR